MSKDYTTSKKLSEYIIKHGKPINDFSKPSWYNKDISIDLLVMCKETGRISLYPVWWIINKNKLHQLPNSFKGKKLLAVPLREDPIEVARAVYKDKLQDKGIFPRLNSDLAILYEELITNHFQLMNSYYHMSTYQSSMHDIGLSDKYPNVYYNSYIPNFKENYTEPAITLDKRNQNEKRSN